MVGTGGVDAVLIPRLSGDFSLAHCFARFAPPDHLRLQLQLQSSLVKVDVADAPPTEAPGQAPHRCQRKGQRSDADLRQS